MKGSRLDEIQGAWDVTTLGIAHPLTLIGDVKYVEGELGYNIVAGKKWGWVNIEIAENNLILNYDDERNSRTLRKVFDIITREGRGWAGTLFLCGCQQFKFRLERAESKKERAIRDGYAI